MLSTDPYIPFAYRGLLLYLEPFFAFNGSMLCLFAPDVFLNTYSPTLRYSPDSQIIYDQLAATYLLFAFNQLVVLRITNDLRVWKAIVAGILVCDTVHLWAGLKVMGIELFMSPWMWRLEDWIAMLTLLIPVSMRVAFLSEVGIKRNDGGYKELDMKANGQKKV